MKTKKKKRKDEETICLFILIKFLLTVNINSLKINRVYFGFIIYYADGIYFSHIFISVVVVAFVSFCLYCINYQVGLINIVRI
jgi:hypothetical protein